MRGSAWRDELETPGGRAIGVRLELGRLGLAFVRQWLHVWRQQRGDLALNALRRFRLVGTGWESERRPDTHQDPGRPRKERAWRQGVERTPNADGQDGYVGAGGDPGKYRVDGFEAAAAGASAFGGHR